MSNIENILESLRTFQPNFDNVPELNRLIEELWETGKQQLGLDELFRFVERYPEADGDYDLFRLVHAFEDINDYENALIKSLDRCPCFINMLLVKRIENSGKNNIKGKIIQDIYLDSLNHELTHQSVKNEINDWLQQTA
ncbi:hypothetical protein [Marinifilum fragile]|uniref:hypothetical protein n=1 Tax=Marinifilum fragile TaxID=570161 RepID=UPI0006CFFDDC|nr:hypothetical protein [Marinifilum fragile]